MANERYIEKAAKLLHAYIESQFETELTAIETEQSLDSGTLTAPVDYVLGNVPDDNRVPLVEVYGEDGEYEDQRNSIYVAFCNVAISYASDCSLEAGKLMVRRYVTALLNTIRDNPSLSSGVIQCILGAGDFEASRGDDSTTRLTYEQPVEVWIHDL